MVAGPLLRNLQRQLPARKCPLLGKIFLHLPRHSLSKPITDRSASEYVDVPRFRPKRSPRGKRRAIVRTRSPTSSF